jgi:hypothetical protein
MRSTEEDLLFLHSLQAYLQNTLREIVSYLRWLGWTPNLGKCKLDPATVSTYLGMQWDTTAMTVQITAKKNTELKKSTELKKTVKKWIRFAEGGVTVRVREIAGLISKLSATRAQHECASLYLARLNRLKCQAVGADGWEARTKMTRTLLPELH